MKKVCAEMKDTSEMLWTCYLSVAVGVGVIAATVAISSAVIGAGGAAILGSTAAVFPVGTIIVGAAIAVGGLYVGISKYLKKKKKKKKAKKAFKLVNGDTQPHKNRYKNFMNELQKNVNSMVSNTKVYSFTSDDEQEVTLPIGNNYYFITITKSPYSPYFSSTIRVNGNGEKDPLISDKRADFPVATDFFDLDENVNMWFVDETLEYQVYILNPSLDSEINESEADRENVKKTLSSYAVIVCNGKLKSEIKTLKKAIDKTIDDFF